MIVVVGSPSYRPPEETAPDDIGGVAAAIARAAAAEGATVQFVGKIGDDAPGDALVLALARAGIGHAAILRDAGHPTPILVAPSGDDGAAEAVVDLVPDGAPLIEAMLDEDLSAEAVEQPASILPESLAERPALQAADLELALRYLTDFSVLVVTEPLDEPSAAVAVAGATYAGAELIAIIPSGAEAPAAIATATILEAPSSDPDEAFARLVGEYAAALDRGVAAADAFRQATARAGWEIASS